MLNMAGNTVHPCQVQTILITHAKTIANNYLPNKEDLNIHSLPLAMTLKFSQPDVLLPNMTSTLQPMAQVGIKTYMFHYT
jgi:hypothetical protein